MPDNSILAIDPGTKCGWALRTDRDGATISWVSGTWDLSAKRHEGGGMRFLRLRSYLNQVFNSSQVSCVFYEEVRRHMGVDAAHVYGGIIAVISEECEARKIPYMGVPVGTVKKHATGKGNADKEAMIAAAQARWPGVVFVDDNEADARWICVAGMLEVAEG